ncbi:SubName: Full=Uncharacterized protein {ECO:0000313/EMBL:CCA71570.1} [Serendipita indica DSM 11827]|nr:SubName: Full=Uncharacterized protein {ECO:0000313/EMBL:CCA71570.1} [Serendipita indica DSM 11827]
MSGPFVCPFSIQVQPGALRFDTTLMFSFNPLKGAMWNNYTIAWMVIPFNSSSTVVQTGTLVYTSQLGFSRPQSLNGNIVAPGITTKINVENQTNLVNKGATYDFTAPTPYTDDPSAVVANNNTTAIQPISVGFFDPSGTVYTPALLFKDVPVDSSVVAEFTPILRCYASSQYQERQFIKGNVQGYIHWEQDLTKDFQTGEYSLTLVPS